MAEELKPCPFCGPGQSQVSLWFDDGAHRWRVGCGRCGCSTGTSPRDLTKTPAIAAWNCRPSPSSGQTDGLVERLTEAQQLWDGSVAAVAAYNANLRASKEAGHIGLSETGRELYKKSEDAKHLAYEAIYALVRENVAGLAAAALSRMGAELAEARGERDGACEVMNAAVADYNDEKARAEAATAALERVSAERDEARKALEEIVQTDIGVDTGSSAISAYGDVSATPYLLPQWQTIDSAPRDGTHILTWTYPWAIAPAVLQWVDGEWRDDDRPMPAGETWTPTHWMLPPATPEQPT